MSKEKSDGECLTAKRTFRNGHVSRKAPCVKLGL